MPLSTITATAAPDGCNPRPRPGWPPADRPDRIDQTDRANFIIGTWLALNPHDQDGFLAQLIAATIHGGPGTVLERFAASGYLDAEAALAELNDIVVPIEREPWLDALGRYIINSGDRS